ncbi:hypothetical protein [Roseisalinus antarcticus]|uniref:DUF2029 domain-containing protein n=1 Tax=Roseisalinus antarcticus TaxID=254357 RepID=A0A1Y5T0E0_9RHOB|nr:hypothetical protein [Roseisalinus antarcticus]SLN50833.1 hypothetical protein ROA7023_02209 [Roseisalinus antarcticus]
MFRIGAIQLAAWLALLLLVLGGAAVLKGGLYLGKHEGDLLHLMQITLRMASGDLPHLDFMTPIGMLAFAPMALLVAVGMGIGHAVLWAQVLSAALVAPAVWWVGATRLARGPAMLLTLFVMVLMLALVHGEATPALSISMHYNRWAWALVFIAIVAALIPPFGKGTGTADGLVIGLCMAVVALIKVTYFVAFAPPVLIALVLTGQRRALAVALIAGLVVVGAMTVLLGPSFWLAYFSDLREVAGSSTRPRPGLPLSDVVAGTAYLGGTLAALASVVFLRQAGAETGGLIVLLLIPGFIYVTFQNFGNDPQWLLLLAVLLLSLKPASEGRNGFGLTHKAALGGTAAVVLALTAPSFLNLAYSPFRHYFLDTTKYVPVLPRGGVNADIHAAAIRARRTDIKVPVEAPDLGLPAFRPEEDRTDPVIFMGETRAYCSLELGLIAVFDAVARDLEDAGYGGRPIFVADLLSSFWLFGDLSPLPGGAPWYYSGLPGLEAADFIIVPTCPISPTTQSRILSSLNSRGTDDLTEVRRTALYTLYRIGAVAGAAEVPVPDPAPEAPAALPRAASEAADPSGEVDVTAPPGAPDAVEPEIEAPGLTDPDDEVDVPIMPEPLGGPAAEEP